MSLNFKIMKTNYANKLKLLITNFDSFSSEEKLLITSSFLELISDVSI